MPGTLKVGTVPALSPRAQLLPLLILSIVGCNHQEAFSAAPEHPVGPHTPGAPLQLTYSLTDDLTPAWLPDGSGIAYTWTTPDTAHNRCLAVISPAGGARHHEKCWRADLLPDSIAALNWVSVAPDGRAAWVDAVGKRVRIAPDRSAIRVGDPLSGDTGVAVRSFLYLAPSGNLHMTATSLTWLSPTSLAYVAGALDWPRPCGRCKADTVITGVEVAILDLTRTPADVRIVPNTEGANSLVASPDGSTIYYTLGGDSRVIQQVLASGDTSTLYDFGPLGIGWPSDLSMGGGFLLATLGFSPGFGGELVRVKLSDGSVDRLPSAVGTDIRGRLSPDGHSIVVQAQGGSMDLWLYDLP